MKRGLSDGHRGLSTACENCTQYPRLRSESLLHDRAGGQISTTSNANLLGAPFSHCTLFLSGSNKLIYSNLCASIVFPSLLTNFLARIVYNLFLFSFFGLSNESIAKYVNKNKSNLDLFPYELQIYVCYVINNIFINAYFTFLFVIDHRLSISFIEYFSLISPRRKRIASFE